MFQDWRACAAQLIGINTNLMTGPYIKDSSRWVVTPLRGLYKPHIGPLPLYEPYMSLIRGYPPDNYPPETVPDYIWFECKAPSLIQMQGLVSHGLRIREVVFLRRISHPKKKVKDS